MNEPMLVEGEEICRIDKKVPGTKIELIFVLHYRSKKYEATITAVREGKQMVRQRLFDRFYNPDINAWTGTLVDAINKQFGTAFQGHLRDELEHILPTQTVTPTTAATPAAPAPIEPMVVSATQEAAPASPVPTPEPSIPELPEVPSDDLMLMPEPLKAEDLWEAHKDSMNPTEDIVTLLRVNKELKGFTVYLRVEMGANEPAEQFTGVNTVSEIGDWLRKFSMAAAVAQKLGTKQPGPYDLVRRWTEVFTEPLRQFQARVA